MANKFNITLSDIMDRYYIDINEFSRPNVNGANSILDECATTIEREASRFGIDTSEITSSDDNYELFKRMLIYLTITQILIASDNGGSDGYKNFQEMYDASLKDLRERTNIFVSGAKNSRTRFSKNRQIREQESKNWYNTISASFVRNRS